MDNMLYPSAKYQDRSAINPLFPLFQYYDLLTTPAGVGMHWHNEIEFLVVLHGLVDLQYGSRTIVLKQGDVVFLNSSVLHGFRPHPGTEHACPLARPLLIHPSLFTSNGFDIIQSKYISPMLAGEIDLPVIFPAEEAATVQIRDLLDRIADYLKETPYGHEILIKSCIFSLLAALLQTSRAPQSSVQRAAHSKTDSDRFKKILLYIYEHYTGKITISELASFMHMSEGHFSRFFKRMTNKTAIEYINEYKISQAAKMLCETDKKETEIALDIGFDNFSYFISTFKSIVHCTPSQYRRNKMNSVR